MHPMLNIAVRAARRAGSIINRAALEGGALEVKAKNKNDFVTQVDKAAEQAIIDIIRRAYPEHAILAEESGATAGARAELWFSAESWICASARSAVPSATGVSTWNTAWRVPPWPGGKVPRFQVTTPAARVPPPVAETKLVPGGRGKVSTAPIALATLRLPKVAV